MTKNYGVDILAQGRKWSDRVEEYQLARGNAVTLRSRANAEIARNEAAIEAMKDCLNGEAVINELTVRNEFIRTTLKESLEREAKWGWTDRENQWAKSIVKAETNHAAIMLTVGLFADEYGMTVTKDWAAQIVNACGLRALGNNSARGFVGTGRVEKKKATPTSCKVALMCWSCQQMRINGMRKYMFATDIVEMYANKKKKA